MGDNREIMKSVKGREAKRKKTLKGGGEMDMTRWTSPLIHLHLRRKYTNKQ